MKTVDFIIKSAITGLFTVAATLTVSTALADDTKQISGMEKCYGIAKAEFNDCQTLTQSCAGSATKNNQTDAFIFLPKGVCNKIVGGSLTPVTSTKMK